MTESSKPPCWRVPRWCWRSRRPWSNRKPRARDHERSGRRPSIPTSPIRRRPAPSRWSTTTKPPPPPMPLKVQFQQGKWLIASHYNYRVDIGDRLAKTAAALMDLKKDMVRSDSPLDHAKYRRRRSAR